MGNIAPTLKRLATLAGVAIIMVAAGQPGEARTQKPALHGRHWMAVTGKPLAATAGAMIFQKGGNAVDAACAMIAATSTMWDTLSWGGETQALIYNPNTGKVIGINALGVAPTGATPEFFHEQGMKFPPEFGPLAAVTPGTPGGLMTMLAEYGTMSLAEVLAPAIEMADGYPMEAELSNTIEKYKDRIVQWPYSKQTLLIHPGEAREGPQPGEIFHQPELAATLRKLVEAEKTARAHGKDRKAAIYAAYDRFYKGDIAQELVRGTREQGGLFTLEDLANWKVHIEEPVHTNYKGIEVYKLTTWVQGPVMLQALNILENFDLKAMGYDSARYIHTLYQAMNLSFADRDFYYGDPAFPPASPIEGLLSKEYARERAKLVKPDHNDPDIRPRRSVSVPERDQPVHEHSPGLAQQDARGHPRGGGPMESHSAGRVRPQLQARNNECRGDRRKGLGCIGHPERRLDARGHCGAHRSRPEPAHAEFRARRQREPVQRTATWQAPTGDPHTYAGPEGWQAFPGVLRPGRRHPGSKPAAVLSQCGRVRYDTPGGDRSGQHHQLPDA